MTDIDWEAERLADVAARRKAQRKCAEAYAELSRRSTAVHEAGHAVIGLQGGLQIEDVVLASMASGHVSWANAFYGVALGKAAAAGDLAATRLGFASGADHRHIGIGGGEHGDLQTVVRCVVGFEEREIDALLSVTKHDVRESWDAICAVADALVAARTLTGEQVKEILARDNAGAAERFESRCRELVVLAGSNGDL